MYIDKIDKYDKNNIKNKNIKNKTNIQGNNISNASKKDRTIIDKNIGLSKKAEDEHLIKIAIDNANKMLQNNSRRLQYDIHEKTKQIIVTVINAETKEVIREVPARSVLDSYAQMLELAGLLVDKQS